MFIETIVVLFKINLILFDSVRAGNASLNDIESKIVGGRVTRVTRYPHSVFLVINGNRMCGSSIIRDRVLLSAAHCFNEIPPSASVRAYIGSENPKKAKQVIRADKWIVHRQFSMKTLKNDICLIHMKRSIAFGNNVKKILLPVAWPKPHDTGFVAGWGHTEINGRGGGNILKSVKQIIRSKRACEKVFGGMNKSQFCAGFARINNLPYSGDSGSALLLNGNIQVGIVSSGRPWISGYIVYTSTMYYKTWIINNTNRLMNTTCQVI